MPITIERRRNTPEFRPLTVTAVETLSPNLKRITLGGEALKGFDSAGFDDHIKVFFPNPGEEMVLPTRAPDGLIWPEDRKKPEMRDYTPRSFSDEALVLDFVVHGDGVATTWAQNAKVGDGIAIGGPRGSFVVNTDVPRQVLIGDLTAYPAIARRLEDLPETVEAVVLLAADEANQALSFTTRAKLELQFIGPTAADLITALREIDLPAEECFVFAGHEASVVGTLREHLAERGVPSDHTRVSNYWREGVAQSDAPKGEGKRH